MDKYFSAYDLLRRWGIKTIQLFNRCKKGELQPYNWREEKIVTLDSYIETKEYKEFISKRKQELKRIEKGTHLAGTVLSEHGIYTPIESPTDEYFEREAIKDFRPKDCDLFDYGLPRIDSAAKQKLINFLKFSFKESDIKRYEIEHGLYEPDIETKEIVKQDISSPDIIDKAPEQIFDNFIRSLRISYENENGIKIHKPGKVAKDVNFGMLGFKDNKTKEWEAFLEIINKPPHVYFLGSASKTSAGIKQPNKDYEAKRKLLYEIDIKLKTFLNKEFGLDIPKSLKTYERCPEEGQGAYKFKFKVIHENEAKGKLYLKYENLPKDELFNKMKKLKNKGTYSEEFMVILTIAASKKWITEDQVKDMMPDTFKTDSTYAYFENKEDRGPDS
jgi:hypothetical protein